jgi:hypothetical protein
MWVADGVEIALCVEEWWREIDFGLRVVVGFCVLASVGVVECNSEIRKFKFRYRKSMC